MARPKAIPAPTLKAVGYVRVSTSRQADEGISMEHQADEIRAYCTTRGLELVAVVTEAGHSAYKQTLTRRAEGKKVVELIRGREVGAVVALRLDRLFRSISDCVATVGAWDKSGVALHLISLGGQAVDTGSVMGRAMLALMAAFGEMESEAKSERASDCWDYKRTRGERLGSVAPFGYRMENARAVEDEHEQNAIRLIRRLRSEGNSVRAIREGLERSGLRPRGVKWNATTIVRVLARAT